jgi:hypothetical protein
LNWAELQQWKTGVLTVCDLLAWLNIGLGVDHDLTVVDRVNGVNPLPTSDYVLTFFSPLMVMILAVQFGAQQ